MIPILRSSNGYYENPDSEGLGRLAETISCSVKEQRNGEYELQMVYPVGGQLFHLLDTTTTIVAKPNYADDPQPFTVYKVSMAINGRVTVNAHHRSYMLSYIPVKSYAPVTGIRDALLAIQNNAMANPTYVLNSDITNTTSTFPSKQPRSFRACLGGQEGSLLDVFGGELKFDRFNVRLLKNRGVDSGIWISYGKNMSNIVKELNSEETYTGVVAYWGGDVGNVQYVSGHSQYNEKIFMLDVSGDYTENPGTDVLNARAAKYRDDNNVGVPKQTLSISMADLHASVEFKNIATAFDQINLCDTVHVYYPQFNVNTDLKVIETNYDVLNERYTSVVLGSAKSNMAATLQKQINNSINRVVAKSRL